MPKLAILRIIWGKWDCHNLLFSPCELIREFFKRNIFVISLDFFITTRIFKFLSIRLI